MKQIVCSVYDGAARLYGRPFAVAAAGVAIRTFTDEVNRKDAERGDMARHPDDFDLWVLGSFDDNSGLLAGEPTLLIRGKDVKEA